MSGNLTMAPKINALGYYSSLFTIIDLISRKNQCGLVTWTRVILWFCNIYCLSYVSKSWWKRTKAAIGGGLWKKSVLKNFEKFIGKQLCQSLFFNKFAGLSPATSLKKRLWHRCFPVNFARFLRTPFLKNTSGWLLLKEKDYIKNDNNHTWQ